MSLSPLKSISRRPVGKRVPTPARSVKTAAARASAAAAAAAGAGLPLPHERDESTRDAALVPDPLMAQAKRDLDAGLVDTDMRASPGLDAPRRAELVPGPGGKPPASSS